MTIHVSCPSDFSFHETVSAHGWLRLLPFVWRDSAPAGWSGWRPPDPETGRTGILERVEKLPDGRVVRIEMAEDGQGCIAVDVDADDVDREEIVQRVRRMLQLDIDISPFHTFASGRPQLSHVAARRQGRVLRAPTLFEDVIKVITTTNTTWSQTVGMVRRLVGCYGAPYESIEYPGLRRAFPTPQAIAETDPNEFANAARLGYRSAAVHSLAVDIAEGRLDLESWQNPALSAEDLEKRLLTLRGVGPYAAACLMLYLGKPAKIAVDSYARMKVAGELGRAATDRDVRNFFAEFGDWRGLAYYCYAWSSSPQPEDMTNSKE
ncbi:MAG: DNA-3-methyladenine glycosylase family protein [Capsulimonadaceae bacterium]